MGVQEAFAPAAITNFFSIYDEGLLSTPPDLAHVGATGGGYMLSKGVFSRAEVVSATGPREIKVIVNGDAEYDASTTRRAVELLLEAVGGARSSIKVHQAVEVPIGYGFGASAASALSGVMAVASAMGIRASKSSLAFFAHSADILCRTGLGTVSAIYNYGGAGIMTTPGGPGVAQIRSVAIPKGLRIVTASLAPYEKKIILSSSKAKEKVNRLGDDALTLASDLAMESLIRAGEEFSDSLGVMSPEIRHLVSVAKANGAIGASQNMVGQAMHALVFDEDVEAVAGSLRDDALSPLVGVYDFGPAAH